MLEGGWGTREGDRGWGDGWVDRLEGVRLRGEVYTRMGDEFRPWVKCLKGIGGGEAAGREEPIRGAKLKNNNR